MGVAELREILEDKIMARRTKHGFHSKQGDSSNVLEEKQWDLTDVGSGSTEVLKITVIC